MPALASLTTIPVVILGLAGPSPEARLDVLKWGTAARHMEFRFPGAIRPVSAAEAHDHANGFGIPQQRLQAKVFGVAGAGYLLYGRRSQQLVSLYWAPADPATCPGLEKSLRMALGKPTDVDPNLATLSWENEDGDLDVSFTKHSSACRLLFTPFDPYAFD